MELCTGCRSSQLSQSLLHLSHFPLSTKCILHFNQRVLTSLKLPSFSTQFHLRLPLHTRSTSFNFATLASSSSSSVNIPELEKLPADLEVTEREEPNSRIRLNVGVPPAVCQDCYKGVMKEFMKQAKVPGFRPGKNVPEDILVNFIGKRNVDKAIVESILKRTLPHAMASWHTHPLFRKN